MQVRAPNSPCSHARHSPRHALASSVLITRRCGPSISRSVAHCACACANASRTTTPAGPSGTHQGSPQPRISRGLWAGPLSHPVVATSPSQLHWCRTSRAPIARAARASPAPSSSRCARASIRALSSTSAPSGARIARAPVALASTARVPCASASPTRTGRTSAGPCQRAPAPSASLGRSHSSRRSRASAPSAWEAPRARIIFASVLPAK